MSSQKSIGHGRTKPPTLPPKQITSPKPTLPPKMMSSTPRTEFCQLKTFDEMNLSASLKVIPTKYIDEMNVTVNTKKRLLQIRPPLVFDNSREEIENKGNTSIMFFHNDVVSKTNELENSNNNNSYE